MLSVPQDHSGSHNNFMNFFPKNYTLYGVYIFSNFGFRLNHLTLNDTKTHFYISEVVQSEKELFFRFQFYKFIGKYSKIRSLLLN